MSQENVEVVRRAIDGFNQGQLRFETLDPTVEWHTNPNLPDATTHHGHAAAGDYLTSWTASFEDFAVAAEELVDAGEHVVASMRFRGRMKGSTQAVELAETHVWRFRDGRAVEIREYSTREEALEAVGLSE